MEQCDPDPSASFGWLTGLGPPVVLLHAGGPPHDFAIGSCGRSTSFDSKVRDEHRLPVRASIESGEYPSSGSCGSISCGVRDTRTRLRRAVRTKLDRIYAGAAGDARRRNIVSECDDPKEVLTRVSLMPDDEVEQDYEAVRLATRRLVAMNVTELRVTRQLSQVELARRSGITERELEDVEAGAGEMLIDTLSSLADGLNVDVTFLFRKRADDVH